MYPPPEIPRKSVTDRLVSAVGSLLAAAVAPMLRPGARLIPLVGTRRSVLVWDRSIDI